MIGTDLNLVLPSLTEMMAENIGRIRTALSLIEDSMAQKATPAALDMTAPLDMQGNALVDVSSIVFTSGNSSETPGSIFYFAGDWYVVDAVGTIQITDAGQLNAASVGGIKGDYGGVNPAAVTYVDSSGQYVFTESAGVYADLVADDLILQGATGSVTFAVDAALAGTRTISIKSLPSSGKSLLVYDAATSTLEDNAVTRATNAALFTDIDVSGEIKHGEKTVNWFPPWIYRDASGLVNPAFWTGDAMRVQISGSGGVHRIPGPPLRVGWRLKKVNYEFNSATNPTADALIIQNYDTGTAKAITVSGTSPFRIYTLNTPYAVAAGDVLWLKITPGTQAIDFARFELVYDIV